MSEVSPGEISLGDSWKRHFPGGNGEGNEALGKRGGVHGL